jgi:hypothetical protein
MRLNVADVARDLDQGDDHHKNGQVSSESEVGPTAADISRMIQIRREGVVSHVSDQGDGAGMSDVPGQQPSSDGGGTATDGIVSPNGDHGGLVDSSPPWEGESTF